MPIEKNNQISALSNFARNIGGSAGTAMLTTFISRTAQTHMQALGANLAPNSTSLGLYTAEVRGQLLKSGIAPAQTNSVAFGEVYRQMQSQATMLAYHNAFVVLSAIILCLVPLPFIMRLPKKRAQAAEPIGH